MEYKTLPITTPVTVGEIVAHDYRTAEVFKRFGIDFCCGGKKPLSKVCQDKGVAIEELQEALLALDASPVTATLPFDEWDLPFLAEYIVNVHHQYVRVKVPLIIQYAEKVARVHGERYPENMKIAELFMDLGHALLLHLQKEEEILFPYIKNLAQSETNPVLAAAFSVNGPIQVMEMEHEEAGELMDDIRQLSHDFTPPEGACNTYRVLYSLLQEFEEDLHQHVHLENNILFPKVIALKN